jgi:hypothetical protein
MSLNFFPFRKASWTQINFFTLFSSALDSNCICNVDAAAVTSVSNT